MKITEELIINIIVTAGEAKSCALAAIAEAKALNWLGAEQKLLAAQDAYRLCHEIQTQFISQDGGCGQIEVSLILVHAQDHVTSALLVQELAKEIIDLHRLIHHSIDKERS